MTGRPSRRRLFGYAGADAAPFARPAWRQTGFWNGTGPDGHPVTGRNLFGQVDGTGNPAPGTPDFDATVWADTPDALNEWTTTIGSAGFALPPGFTEGNWLAQSLLG